MISAQVVPLIATIDPAERSIPPEMITTDAPRAMMPSNAVLRRMMSRLSAQALKYVPLGSRNPVPTKTTTIAARRANS